MARSARWPLALLAVALLTAASARSDLQPPRRLLDRAATQLAPAACGRRLVQQPGCTSCPGDASQTCGALSDSERMSIRSTLIGNCASSPLLAELPGATATCCGALPAAGTDAWRQTVACMCAGDSLVPGLTAFVNAQRVLTMCTCGSGSGPSPSASTGNAPGGLPPPSPPAPSPAPPPPASPAPSPPPGGGATSSATAASSASSSRGGARAAEVPATVQEILSALSVGSPSPYPAGR